jgi:hypothetical protein
VFRPSPLFTVISVEPEVRFRATDPGSPGH